MAEDKEDVPFLAGVRSDFQKMAQKGTALALFGGLTFVLTCAGVLLHKLIAEPLWAAFATGSVFTAIVLSATLFLLGVYSRWRSRVAEAQRVEQERDAERRRATDDEIRAALSLVDRGTLDRFDMVYKKYAAMVSAAHDLLRLDISNSVSMEEQEGATDPRVCMVRLIDDHVARPSNEAFAEWGRMVRLAREVPVDRRDFDSLLAAGDASIDRTANALRWIYRAGQALSKWDDLLTRPSYQTFFARYLELLETLRSSDLPVAQSWLTRLSVLQGFPPRPPSPPS